MQSNIPSHIAIIMDGNGRWATKRLLPRAMGHRAGTKAVRGAIRFCLENQIKVLSLFSLSVENFVSRPRKEIDFLLDLFSQSIQENLEDLNANQVRIRFIGDLSILNQQQYAWAKKAETLTKDNVALNLVLAINYSGRWDLFQAAQRFSQYVSEKQLDPHMLAEKEYAQFLSLVDLPEPDLMLRTSGEKRISNFMLWQLAYTELCFIDEYWPDCDEAVFARVLADYQSRERRFGMTGEQLKEK